MVAHDSPGDNPFHEVVPIALEHPFLLHILIATSAIHWSNISHPETTSLLLTAADPGQQLQFLRANGQGCRQAFLDALSEKQRAIGQMRAVIENLDSVGGELALIAVLFFVNFELLDLGKTGWWKAHLLGASRLISLLQGSSRRHARSASTRLLDYVLSDFFM
jgi:hypothetical protein